jgi:hypothetical protein
VYAITYSLFVGTSLHRARSATAALEEIALLQQGGGRVIEIIVTRTGQQITLKDLQILAQKERPV